MNFLKKNYKQKSVNRIDVSKALKTLVLALTITFSSSIFANTNPIKNSESASVSKTVGELLEDHDFLLQDDENAIVELFVNQNDEMIVLSVNTNNKNLESYIKDKLNYKKVTKEAISNRRSFKVPVRFLKSK